jgi:hypothetical protein
MHDLYNLKEMLMDELKEYGRKGELNSGSLEVVDKLAHAVKNICKVIDKYEEEEEYGEYGPSFAQGRTGGTNRGGNAGGNRGRSGANSYARGRGGNARRDTMGRYSRAEDEVSGMIDDLRDMMQDLPVEKQREVKKFIDKMEQM